MLHGALADLVLLLHLAFIIFVVGGGLLAMRWRWVPIIHLPAAAWGVLIEVSGGVCPLTPLENALRRAAGSSGYAGSFTEHYVVPLIYPESLSYSVQLVLAALVLACNALVYLAVFRRRRALRRLAA
jgi:hypothetical protein